MEPTWSVASPRKGGQLFEGKVPIFNTVAEAVEATDANASVIFVPPPFAADAICEAADAGIKLIVAITEGIPANDMVKAWRYMEGKDCRLIGPTVPASSPQDSAKSALCPDTFIKKVEWACEPVQVL